MKIFTEYKEELNLKTGCIHEVIRIGLLKKGTLQTLEIKYKATNGKVKVL